MARKSSENIEAFWKRVIDFNDAAAFQSLFYALNARLIRYCLFYIHQKQAAEEIVSDVFVKFWLQRKNLKHVKKPETYLFVMVKNRAINYNKRHSSIHLVSLEDATNDIADTFRADLELEKKELFFRLDHAIDSLPQQSRIIFKLAKEEGLKYKEVAEILGVSPRTVQTQLYRAMKKLSCEMRSYLQYANHPSLVNIEPVVVVGLILALGIFFSF